MVPTRTQSSNNQNTTDLQRNISGELTPPCRAFKINWYVFDIDTPSFRKSASLIQNTRFYRLEQGLHLKNKITDHADLPPLVHPLYSLLAPRHCGTYSLSFCVAIATPLPFVGLCCGTEL
jgi:hypothetical protein